MADAQTVESRRRRPLRLWPGVSFSGAPWSERLGAIVLMVAALAAIPYILLESVLAGKYAPAALSLGFVAWAVVTGDLPDRLRRAWSRPSGARPQGQNG